MLQNPLNHSNLPNSTFNYVAAVYAIATMFSVGKTLEKFADSRRENTSDCKVN